MVGFFDIGVGHWHVRPESGPLYSVPFRIHQHGTLGVVILHRSGARFPAEHDIVRSWRVRRNRTRTGEVDGARAGLAHARRSRCRCCS